MSQPSIKKNFAYKSALTISTYIMGFITFPYISRVFGVERLGLINFVDNAISYFLLFASMGIGVLGVREIAATKDEVAKRDKVFANLLGLNLWFTLIVLSIYVLMINCVPKFEQYVSLFYVGAAKIFFTTFLVEWFYSGIEDFRYITLRSIAVKLLYVLAVFVFVREPDQYLLYFALTVGVVVVNAVINILYCRRYVTLRFADMFSLCYLRKNVELGIYSIMTSMYLTFNVMYLGLVADISQVGYYTTAFKLYSVILGLFSAFTSVMLPRMSALLAEDDHERFRHLINKSFTAVARFSIPLILCSMVLARQIIYLLSGPGYDGAVLPMQIIMPAILFVGIAQILAIQVLLPLKRDRVLLMASVAGAFVSIFINVFVVPRLLSIGSALVLIGAEATVTFVYLSFVIKRDIVKIHYGEMVGALLGAIPLVMVSVVISRFIDNPLYAIVIAGVSLPALWLTINKVAYKRFIPL